MLLSKLQLHGFKSFADETTLDFAPGITAIVGPNGCGKSNIVDAVRWVIGEQRPSVLRADTMDNLIFNGTARRRPVGMAEVELTIENTEGVLPTEYTEVVLGRRLYRSGTSEYLINRSQSRLKDIRSLFMDTGMGADAYSVIELKMIDEILSENADDRRRLFEEAAGITKYKQRRRQALRKLEQTQADLDRVRDLTDEVQGRVKRLSRQADKAQRHQELDAELQRLELQLAQAEHDRLAERRHTLREKHDALDDEIEALSSRRAQAEARQEKLRTEQVECEQDVAEHQKRLNEHQEQTRDRETERKLQRQRLDSARDERERLHHEDEQAETRRRELNDTAERLKRELGEAEPEREQAEQTLEQTKQERDRAQADAGEKRERLQTARQRENEAAQERREHERKLDRLTNRRDLKEEEQARLQTEARDLSQQADQLDQRAAKAETKADEAERALREARKKLQDAEAEHADRQNTLEEQQDELRRIQRERDAVSAEVELLEGLVGSYEEFGDAVQFVMEHAPDALGDDAPRTVADLIGCDDAHRRALDAALGPLASCLVVNAPSEAARIRTLLRESDEGRVTVLARERLAGRNGAEKPEAVTAQPLRELVRTAGPGDQAVADALLHRRYLASSWQEATEQARAADPPATFFTPLGEWASAGGLRHGGGKQANGASPVAQRFGRKEQLDEAHERLDRIQSEEARQKDEVSAARNAAEAVPLDERREQVQQAEQAHAEAEREREQVAYERETLREQQDQLEDRRETLHDETEEARAQVAAAKDALADDEEVVDALRSKREKAEAAYDEAESEAREAADRHSEAQVAAVEARNRCDNLRRERERIQEALDELRARSDERSQRLREAQDTIAEAETDIDRLEDELSELHRNQGDLEEAVDAAKNELLETKSDLDEIEQTLRDLRREHSEAVEKQNESAVQLTETETRLDALRSDIREDYGRSLDDDPVALPDDFEEDATQKRVGELRAEIDKLGSVNPLALEEYEEEKERLDFLRDQQSDLEDAEETLLETISEINDTATAQFDETYEAIRENFSRLFAELFGRGAKADLELVDPEDPLESPIEIRAKPRGKRPTSIAQLSSGEKALTAIALLFAIYLVKPSPFCVLDEVDAPLDDANVERFMKLLRNFTEDTQFILVTHNKLTMEAADRLYGVTMQEQGVSTLVGVEMEEAAALVES
jgi:chromosome segregation protein